MVDEPRLLHPGDLLHEAGHIAIASLEERKREKFKPTLGDEITAIAWSYAAACHLGIDPAIVFHPAGYRGASSAFLTNFAAGRYVGTPLLQSYGMTVEPKRALAEGTKPFPWMLRWVRSGPLTANSPRTAPSRSCARAGGSRGCGGAARGGPGCAASGSAAP